MEASWRHSSDLAVYYTDDAVVGARAVDVRGSDGAGAEALLIGLAAELDVYTHQELVRMVDDADTPGALMRAVHSVYAMSNCDWPEYRPLLRQIATDPDPGVREMVRRVMAAYDAAGVPCRTNLPGRSAPANRVDVGGERDDCTGLASPAVRVVRAESCVRRRPTRRG